MPNANLTLDEYVQRHLDALQPVLKYAKENGYEIYTYFGASGDLQLGFKKKEVTPMDR